MKENKGKREEEAQIPIYPSEFSQPKFKHQPIYYPTSANMGYCFLHIHFYLFIFLPKNTIFVSCSQERIFIEVNK